MANIYIQSVVPGRRMPNFVFVSDISPFEVSKNSNVVEVVSVGRIFGYQNLSHCPGNPGALLLIQNYLVSCETSATSFVIVRVLFDLLQSEHWSSGCGAPEN